jgi:hypothetical protein
MFFNSTNEEFNEIYAKYQSSVTRADAEKALNARFTDVNGMTDDSYRLVINERTLIIILPDGFKEKIKCPNYRLSFIRDVLKSLYSISDIKTITNSTICEYYIKCLYQRSKVS